MKLHTSLITAILLIPLTSFAQEKPVEKPTISQTFEETISKNLDKFSEFISSAGNTTYDFASKEVPLFIQEYLLYNFWKSLLICISAVLIDILIMSVIGFFALKIWKYGKAEDETTEPHIVIPLVLCSVIMFLMLLMTHWDIVANSQWLQIKLAPRVYMVQELKSFIHNK